MKQWIFKLHQQIGSASILEKCIRAWSDDLIWRVRIQEKGTNEICHRYQLYEYKRGNIYVGCRTGKKSEDYKAPKLKKSELCHTAEERKISL